MNYQDKLKNLQHENEEISTKASAISAYIYRIKSELKFSNKESKRYNDLQEEINLFQNELNELQNKKKNTLLEKIELENQHHIEALQSFLPINEMEKESIIKQLKEIEQNVSTQLKNYEDKKKILTQNNQKEDMSFLINVCEMYSQSKSYQLKAVQEFLQKIN